jgi:pyruvate/2-oxoglutarate dehydrogenase complex dihydrolipoamide acyltransferase (E2) component
MTASSAPVTREQLELAYSVLRRPHWPDTLDSALAHPIYAGLIRGQAQRLHRRGIDRAPQPPRPPVVAPDPPPPTLPEPPAVPHPAPAPARAARVQTHAPRPTAPPATGPADEPRADALARCRRLIREHRITLADIARDLAPLHGRPPPRDAKRAAANDRDD